MRKALVEAKKTGFFSIQFNSVDLVFPTNEYFHKINDWHIYVVFVSLNDILSDSGGFVKAITFIFTILFGVYFYDLFIYDLAKTINQEES